jgi:hypothetical protein
MESRIESYDTAATNDQRSGISAPLWLLAFAAGASLAYFADPDRGSDRRARVGKGATSLFRSREDSLDKIRREVRKRARGVAKTAKAIASSDFPTDAQLVSRVRTHLENFVDDARAVAVSARGGVVELIGSILFEERDRLLAAVRAVPGVRSVVDHLHETYQEDDRLARGASAPRRIAAGTLGSALLAFGLSKRGHALPAAFVGAGLLARSFASGSRARSRW